MRRFIAVLLIFGLLLTLGACTQQAVPVSTVEELTPTAQPAAEPTATPEPEQTSTYPSREPVHHDWDGAGTLYPYAQIDLVPPVYPFVFELGAILPTNNLIHYLDFASEQIVPFCFRPNCQHNNEDCDALVSNSSNWCFVANNKFYYLDAANTHWVYHEERQAYVSEMDLYVSSLNRSNEKKVGSIYALNFIYPQVSLVVYGDSAFLFSTAETDYANQSDPEENYAYAYLTEIDLESDKIVDSKLIAEGYQASAESEMAYGGGIYLSVFQYINPFSGEGTYDEGRGELVYVENGVVMNQEEFLQYMEQNQKWTYYRYDITTGELEERVDGYPDEYGGPLVESAAHENRLRPLTVMQDWCVYNDGDVKAYNMATGETRVLYENDPTDQLWAVLNIGGVNSVLMRFEGDRFVIYNFDTGESQLLGYAQQEDGSYVSIARITAQIGDHIYGAGFDNTSAGVGYGYLDVSNSYENPTWVMVLDNH